MSHRTIVILLGPPGSGKGSQAQLLKTSLNLPHLSTGDLLREQVSAQSELGKIAKNYIDHGKLVPDGIILDMIQNRVKHSDCEKGFLLDGFPRTLPQAEELQKRLNQDDKVFILNFMISDEIIIERISGRLICTKCQAPYHKKFSPPKISNICDICNSELYQRADDTSDVIKKRLEVYHLQTSPLIAYYKNNSNFYSLDATLPKKDLFEEILELLKS